MYTGFPVVIYVRVVGKWLIALTNNYQLSTNDDYSRTLLPTGCHSREINGIVNVAFSVLSS
jgi:hypothetical protein